MCRALLLCLLFLYVPMTSFAHSFFFDGNLDFSIGYRNDCFDREINADGYTNEKICFDNLSSLQLTATTRLLFCHRYYIRAFGDYGKINEGDGRFLETHGNANRGRAWDFSGGVGYHFCFWRGHYALTPLVGYAHHQLYLKIKKRFKDFKFKETEHPIWQGPWVGFEAAWTPDHCWNILADFTYLVGTYTNGGSQNKDYFNGSKLKTTFSEHLNCIQGVGTRIGLDYFLRNWFSLGVRSSYRYFWGNSGTYKYYEELTKKKKNETEYSRTDTFKGKLNDLCWQTWTIEGSFAFYF